MKDRLNLIKKYHSYFNINLLTGAKSCKLLPTKTQKPTLEISKGESDFFLHSKYDPEKEANNLIKDFKCGEKDIIVVLGLGLGYHLFGLAKNHPDNYFIIVELDNNIYRAFFETVPESFLEKQNIVYLTKENISELSDTISYFTVTKIKEKIKIRIFKHIPSLNLHQERYNQVEKTLLDIAANYYSNLLTEKELKDTWKRNIEKNSKHFEESKKLNELKNKYQNKPMVIVCAGYSLEKNLEFLRENSKKMVIVTVDTSLRFLLRNNIIPDYVMSLDAKYENLGDFKFLDFNGGIKLIFDIVSFPRILEMFRNRYVTYTLKMIKNFYTGEWIEYQDDYIKPVIEEHGDFGGLQSGGSVASNAFDFALFTGANPIYFAGLDLNYFNYKTHCRGTFKEKYLLNRINKFYNYETLNFMTVIMRQNIKKTEGNNIYHYDFILRKYQQWFDNAFKMIKDKEIIRL